MSDIQLRQTFRDRVYKYKPAWILRWGITAISLHIVVIIVLSGFIRYPDVISGTVQITSQTPPLTVHSHVNGKIKQLFIKDGQTVSKGDNLILFDNPININDLIEVENYLQKVEFEVTNITNTQNCLIKFYPSYNLGELQKTYSDFLSKYFTYDQHKKTKLYKKQIQLKENLLLTYKAQRELLNKSINLQTKEFLIVTSQFERDSILYSQNVSTKKDFEEAQLEFIQSQYQLSTLQSNLSSINASISKTDYEISELKIKREDVLESLHNDLLQSIELLSSKIALWKQNYLITAPIDGKVMFLTYWSEQQHVLAGDIALSIEPKMLESKVWVKYPPDNSGKVEVGQDVKIKLDNYNYNEYGSISGKVSYISQTPIQNYFTAEVELDSGMVTSYGINLPLSTYSGTASIIVKKQRLLLKFLNPIKGLINSNKDKI